MSILLSSFSVEMCCLCVTLLCFLCCLVSGGWYSRCSDTRSVFTRQGNLKSPVWDVHVRAQDTS
jgi:hypothetical protein